MHAQHFLIAEREWYRFDIGRLRAEPTNYEFAYTRVTRLRGSQWGAVFYGYRLKFRLFYGYRLSFFSYG